VFVQPVCESQEVTVGNYAVGAKRRGMDLQTIERSGFIIWLRSRVMVSHAMSSFGVCVANLICTQMLQEIARLEWQNGEPHLVHESPIAL
jgi:hypothetical protein